MEKCKYIIKSVYGTFWNADNYCFSVARETATEFIGLHNLPYELPWDNEQEAIEEGGHYYIDDDGDAIAWAEEI